MSLTTAHDIGAALAAYLVTQGCPLPVVDGPEPTKTATWGRERIVLEHDFSGKGSFGAARGLHVNAKHRRTASDPYKITIYARSAHAGATECEHQTRALLVRETVMAGLDYVAAVNKNHWEPKSGGFTVPDDLAKSETQAGAVYEISLTYDLPIRVITFAQAARPEGNIAGWHSTTKVSRTGEADNDGDPNTPPSTAVTACGG